MGTFLCIFAELSLSKNDVRDDQSLEIIGSVSFGLGTHRKASKILKDVIGAKFKPINMWSNSKNLLKIVKAKACQEENELSLRFYR